MKKQFVLFDLDALAADTIDLARDAEKRIAEISRTRRPTEAESLAAVAAYQNAAKVARDPVDWDVDLSKFYVAQNVSPEQANEIGALNVGEAVTFGRGSRLLRLRRVR